MSGKPPAGRSARRGPTAWLFALAVSGAVIAAAIMLVAVMVTTGRIGVQGDPASTAAGLEPVEVVHSPATDPAPQPTATFEAAAGLTARPAASPAIEPWDGPAAGPTMSPRAASTEEPPAAYRLSLGRPEKPLRIRIPAIEVDTTIEEVGLAEDGAMATPQDWFGVGWYSLGYYPGQVGHAVMAGHLDAPRGRKAVFWRLNELRPGDQIFVETAGGRSLVFEVEASWYYPYDNAPLQRIFGPADEARLNLITCRGDWDKELHTYDRRLVVFTRQIGDQPQEREGSLPAEVTVPAGSSLP